MRGENYNDGTNSEAILCRQGYVEEQTITYVVKSDCSRKLRPVAK